jgi:tetratricopeptide (TPR) repeat protein
MRVLIFGVLLATACANPLNRATSDDYARTCAIAEDNGDLATAEQACYRALVNVDMGNLGPELKSERLYNLGRVKRKRGKAEEAEALYKESLQIEESLSGPSSEKVGRRLAELAGIYYVTKQYDKGIPLVERLVPISDKYSGNEKNFVAGMFHFYAGELRARGDVERAAELEAQRNQLGYGPGDFGK